MAVPVGLTSKSWEPKPVTYCTGFIFFSYVYILGGKVKGNCYMYMYLDGLVCFPSTLQCPLSGIIASQLCRRQLELGKSR